MANGKCQMCMIEDRPYKHGEYIWRNFWICKKCVPAMHKQYETMTKWEKIAIMCCAEFIKTHDKEFIKTVKNGAKIDEAYNG